MQYFKVQTRLILVFQSNTERNLSGFILHIYLEKKVT